MDYWFLCLSLAAGPRTRLFDETRFAQTHLSLSCCSSECKHASSFPSFLQRAASRVCKWMFYIIMLFHWGREEDKTIKQSIYILKIKLTLCAPLCTVRCGIGWAWRGGEDAHMSPCDSHTYTHTHTHTHTHSLTPFLPPETSFCAAYMWTEKSQMWLQINSCSSALQLPVLLWTTPSLLPWWPKNPRATYVSRAGNPAMWSSGVRESGLLMSALDSSGEPVLIGECWN